MPELARKTVARVHPAMNPFAILPWSAIGAVALAYSEVGPRRCKGAEKVEKSWFRHRGTGCERGSQSEG